MIRRPPRSTQSRSSAASDVYKRQGLDVDRHHGVRRTLVCQIPCGDAGPRLSVELETNGRDGKMHFIRRKGWARGNGIEAWTHGTKSGDEGLRIDAVHGITPHYIDDVIPEEKLTSRFSLFLAAQRDQFLRPRQVGPLVDEARGTDRDLVGLRQRLAEADGLVADGHFGVRRQAERFEKGMDKFRIVSRNDAKGVARLESET